MAEVKFPQRIRCGSCHVDIYSTPNKGRELYTLSYCADGGRRMRPTFANYADAKAHADEVVEKLARGQVDVLTFNGHERGSYPKLCVGVGFMVYRFSVAAGGEINRSPNFNAN